MRVFGSNCPSTWSLLTCYFHAYKIHPSVTGILNFDLYSNSLERTLVKGDQPTRIALVKVRMLSSIQLSRYKLLNDFIIIGYHNVKVVLDFVSHAQPKARTLESCVI